MRKTTIATYKFIIEVLTKTMRRLKFGVAHCDKIHLSELSGKNADEYLAKVGMLIKAFELVIIYYKSLLMPKK